MIKQNWKCEGKVIHEKNMKGKYDKQDTEWVGKIITEMKIKGERGRDDKRKETREGKISDKWDENRMETMINEK